MNLYTTIFTASVGRIVVGNRMVGIEPGDVNPLRRNSVIENQAFADGPNPVVRELFVELPGSFAVGMSIKKDAGIGVLF